MIKIEKLTPTSFKGIQKDASGGYLVSNEGRDSLKAQFPAWEKNTTEIRLQNLGTFPLPEQTMKLLKEKVQISALSEELTVPEFLRQSHIPLFISHKYAYIPAEAHAICRYFHDMWISELSEVDHDRQIFLGYLILSSFVS